ncbi:ParB/Srx family N-terminal domain-containing protein [Escherichia coli]|uniref:ParB/Srx family N-terminal domain-containing protein n=2 Tax=Enterobacteriaceae TaxID=543 RepID=UPI0025A35A33|nr:ParB/Srx family N-terminal domain-containing protein [Escherichia coli]
MSEKLKIVYRPLQELSPYAHNARTHSTEQVAQLVESIKQFGWTNPVLIDEKGEIIAGHGRVMAAEMLKMDSVPVIVLSGLTDEQKKAYRLADNRLPMNAGWDEDLLRMELSDLINADFDVSLTGFIPTEIDELLTDVLPGTGNEEEPYTTKIDTPVYEPSGGNPNRNMEASALLITPYPIRTARSAAVRERDSFIWLIPLCLMGMRGNYMQGQNSENSALRSCWRIRLPPGVNCCVCFLLAGLYVQINGYRNWKLNGAEWKTRSCAKRSKRWKIMNIPSLWRSILMWLMPE